MGYRGYAGRSMEGSARDTAGQLAYLPTMQGSSIESGGPWLTSFCSHTSTWMNWRKAAHPSVESLARKGQDSSSGLASRACVCAGRETAARVQSRMRIQARVTAPQARRSARAWERGAARTCVSV